MKPTFAGFCIRGLLSVWMSRAMETLCDEINADYPKAMQVTDHGWAAPPLWFSYVPWITQQCERIHEAGKRIILIGHSFGGTSAIMVNNNLSNKGIAVDLLVPIDPAGQYATKINANAKRVVGFYNTEIGQLGHGVDRRGDGWTDAEWKKRAVECPRNETHLQIAADPLVHEKILAEIKTINGA